VTQQAIKPTVLVEIGPLTRFTSGIRVNEMPSLVKKAQPAEAALQKGNFKLQDYDNTFPSGYSIQECSGKRPGVAPGSG
jgi:hypothetical protein